MGHPSQNATGVGPRQALPLALGVAVVAMVGLALAEAFDVALLVDPVETIGPTRLAAWVASPSSWPTSSFPCRPVW